MIHSLSRLPAPVKLLFGKSLSTGLGGGYTWASKIPLSKIVATIGPASEQYPELQKITESGMRIMRINFSHATYDEANLRVTNLRKVLNVLYYCYY